MDWCSLERIVNGSEPADIGTWGEDNDPHDRHAKVSHSSTSKHPRQTAEEIHQQGGTIHWKTEAIRKRKLLGVWKKAQLSTNRVNASASGATWRPAVHNSWSGALQLHKGYKCRLQYKLKTYSFWGDKATKINKEVLTEERVESIKTQQQWHAVYSQKPQKEGKKTSCHGNAISLRCNMCIKIPLVGSATGIIYSKRRQ